MEIYRQFMGMRTIIYIYLIKSYKIEFQILEETFENFHDMVPSVGELSHWIFMLESKGFFEPGYTNSVTNFNIYFL